MRNYLKFVFLVVISLGLLVSVVQAAEHQKRDNLKYGGSLTIARGIEPVVMDSIKTMYGDQAHMLISEPPFQAAPNATPQEAQKSGWVESVSVSPDNLTYTLYLEEGITFQDGKTLDAEAFAWRIRTSLKSGSLMAGVPEWEYIEKVKVVDEYTLQIHLSKPRPLFLTVWTMPAWYGGMATPHAYERYGKDYGHKVAYGNGPFTMTEWIKGDHLTFERYEKYDWGPGFVRNSGPAYLERVIMKIVPEAYSRYRMLSAGEVDAILEVPLSQIEAIEKLDNVNLLSAPSQKLMLLSYNVKKAPLNDLKVRKALNYAINREALAESFFFGYAKPAYSMYMSKSQVTSNTKLLYKYNPDKARQLLEEAGWKEGKHGIREKDGEKLTFRLETNKQTIRRKLASAIQSMWQAIGIKAEVRIFDDSTLRDRVANGKQDATLWRHEWATIDQVPWMADPDTIPYPHQTNYDTKELRELIEETYSSETYKEYHKFTDNVANYIAESATRCPLLRPANLLAIRDVFKNVRLRGPGWWGWMPFLQDVYREDIYQKNMAEQD